MSAGKLFRINKIELKELDKKTREINRILIENNLNAVTDTELLHKVFIEFIREIKVNEDMKITIKD